MRILMLGNSFTFYHGMPRLLAALTGAEVVAHTRGGASLSEQFNPETEMGARTLKALREEKWDYVVLQDQSSITVRLPERFAENVAALCRLIRECGAVPVLYATWAYREGSEKLANLGVSYDKMARTIYDGYHRAAEENGALVADVGKAFFDLTHEVAKNDPKTFVKGSVDLLETDDFHPSAAGSVLAASVIAKTIENHRSKMSD